MDNRQVERTRDYGAFTLLTGNRSIKYGHVMRIINEFRENGNFMKVQPILVNERLEIIDGQHRYIAAREVGEDIYYTVQPGLRVSDARQMNALHQAWTADDYMNSYADSGNQDYIKFRKLREDYGFGHAVVLAYVTNADTGVHALFRNGELTIEDYSAAVDRLNNLVEALEAWPKGNRDREFAIAYLNVMKVDEFQQARMVDKLKAHGDQVMRKYGSRTEYARALEEVYNFGSRTGNRVRLFL